ncbi:hypothetical protein [Dyadobacter sp. 32]|uniref:hypothetical protein n=1 Tax=Dyadobacter sp. 32 TaxID=538966 RepID=UPI0011EC6728
MNKYKDGNREYNSYQDYCNSDDLDPDLIYLYLSNGKRVPQNDTEKKWKAEADRLRSNGSSFELSFN